MRKFLISLTLFIPTLIIPSPVLAHVLKTDGSIGVVLHVDPSDSPVAGQPTFFFFDFKDKNGKYTIENCECKMSLSLNSKNLLTQNIDQAYVDYTFDQPGVYQLRLTGKPGFTLDYNIRVTPALTPQQDKSLYWEVPIILVGLVFFYQLSRMIRQNKNVKNS